MVALLVGSVLAVLGVGFVLWPLVRAGSDEAHPVARPRRAELAPREASALEALREVEFDRATGKISDTDYEALKETLTPLALVELAARERQETTHGEDAAEALIARAKAHAPSCPTDGLRPESDARFCSECGGFLGVSCGACGARVEGSGARFCTDCGQALAA